MYLISRSELIRLIGLDTDTRFLIIGQDDEFIKWIDIGIGKNTTICAHVPENGKFDVILCVSVLEGPERLRLSSLLIPGGSIWELRTEPSLPGALGIPFDSERAIVRSVRSEIGQRPVP